MERPTCKPVTEKIVLLFTLDLESTKEGVAVLIKACLKVI